MTVSWRSFSLPFLHAGSVPEEHSDVIDQYRAPANASTRELRLVESLRAAGDNAAIGRFYAEIGRRTHDAGAMIDDAIVLAAADEAGVLDASSVLDDEKWDDVIRESLDAGGWKPL